MSRKFRFAKACLERIRSFSEMIQEPAREPEKKKEPEAPAGACVVVPRTDIGRVRATNQDAVIFQWPLLGVADGMGGHQGGETASSTARDLLQEYLADKKPDADTLAAAVTSVNHKLYMMQQADEKLRGMGTTLTVLWAGEKHVYIAHVGDSRCYRLRDGKLEQLTQDHSVVAEMVREGMITKEQAATHPMRNIITRAVATEDTVDPDILTFERKRDDRYLLCSDGLYGMMTEERLFELLKRENPHEAADALLREALDNGGRDNITLCILQDTEAAQ